MNTTPFLGGMDIHLPAILMWTDRDSMELTHRQRRCCQVFFCDEPTSGLSATDAETCMRQCWFLSWCHPEFTKPESQQNKWKYKLSMALLTFIKQGLNNNAADVRRLNGCIGWVSHKITEEGQTAWWIFPSCVFGLFGNCGNGRYMKHIAQFYNVIVVVATCQRGWNMTLVV